MRGSQRRQGGQPKQSAERWKTMMLLAAKINELLDQKQLNQSDAAKRIRVSQSKISAIRNHKLNGISLERLLRVLISLGQRVQIVIKPAEEAQSRGVEVVT